MAIRNACVARGSLAATGSTIVYTVPNANALIVKSVLVQNPGSVSANTWVAVVAPGVVLVPFLSQTLAAGQALVWSGWTAANAGDQIFVWSDHTGLAYWVAGAVLPYNQAPAGMLATSEPTAEVPLPEVVSGVVYLPEQATWVSATGTGS